MNLQVAGDSREETLSRVLPQGFEAMSLESELPAQIGADGRMRIQVRAGSWTVRVVARYELDPVKIKIPDAQGSWPKQEVWSYEANDRLRIAALDGGEGIDPAQANVPQEWRRYPSYRVATAGVVQISERSRGMSPQEVNHLSLQRELYLDFARQGYTVIDQISGQMRTGWRLDMRSPYQLMRATSGANNLLVTEASGATLTGVELRAPNLNLTTVARITASGAAIPASGWNERFDHVAGVLNLPPGHRLLAALGADSAPGSWVERWGLLDLFLLSLTTVIAARLFGWIYAAVTFATITLVQQENQFLVWLILFALLAIVSARAAPAGWSRSLAVWARNLMLGALLIATVPFTVTQLRFALYPQLADPGGSAIYDVATAAQSRAPVNALAAAPAEMNHPPPPNYAPEPSAPNYVPPPQFSEVIVTGAKKTAGASYSVQMLQQRIAPGTLVQAGPGVPHWHYVAYPFNWSGPVDAIQTVHFLILSPWLVGIWRVLGGALLVALLVRLMHGDLGLSANWKQRFSLRGATVPSVLLLLAATTLCNPSHAYSTPDGELLNELKTRLTRPPKCVPNCAEIMAIRIALTPTTLEAGLDVATLSSVAVALPTAGKRFDLDGITVDGNPVQGLYRDSDQQIWIPLTAGAHTVKMVGHLPATDSIQLLFPQVPRTITVNGEGWDISGVNAGKLLGNTIELVRRRVVGHDANTTQGTANIPPYVRIHREFALDLD